jgi:hypothetical protein
MTQANQRRRAGGDRTSPTVPGMVYVEFDGVNQHAFSVAASEAFMPGGSPTAQLTGGIVMGCWIKGDHPPMVGQFRVLFSMFSTATAYKGGIQAEYVHSASQQNFACTIYRDGPTALGQSRSWNVASWPDGLFFRHDAWTLVAVAVSKANLQWTRYYNTTRVGQGIDTAEITDFAGGVQPEFGLGYRFMLAGRTNPADDSFVANTATPGQFRAPFIYQLGAESWASIDSLIATVHSAGPTFDHAANGAAGWWPGDGDTYPTLLNRGTAGAAWDLTLANGSQAMLKAVT